MNEEELRALEVRSLATDKLVKALIALLTVREPRLLDELGAVFMLAASEESEVGQGPAAVWTEVRREMELLNGLMRAEGMEPGGDGLH